MGERAAEGRGILEAFGDRHPGKPGGDLDVALAWIATLDRLEQLGLDAADQTAAALWVLRSWPHDERPQVWRWACQRLEANPPVADLAELTELAAAPMAWRGIWLRRFLPALKARRDGTPCVCEAWAKQGWMDGSPAPAFSAWFCDVESTSRPEEWRTQTVATCTICRRRWRYDRQEQDRGGPIDDVALV